MFGVWPKRILHRIILPFTVLFASASLLSWLSSAYLITHFLDRNLSRQVERLGTVITRSSYVLNPAVLRQVKDLMNAEFVVFEPDGGVISTSFGPDQAQDRLQEVLSQLPLLPDGGVDLDLFDRQYRVGTYPVSLPDHDKAIISFWLPTEDARDLKGKVVLFLGMIAILGLVAMGVLGYLIARSITAPVEDLAEVTERISQGDMSQRARLDGGVESAGLAAAFNRMIERLQDFESKLIESEKMATAGQLAAGMAHEIRNPMTSIKMLGQVLHSRMSGQTENRRTFESMIEEINRLDRIVGEMLHRVRPGQVRREWVDVNGLVKNVIRVVSEKMAARRIRVESTLSTELPQAYVDPEKLKQVVWNLILNAEEAMPRGGSLTVTTVFLKPRDMEIWVEDTGMGISESDAGKIFQPFFTTKPEGVGLGLTVSRKIVEALGGVITLANRGEGGVKATVRLPLVGDA